MHVLPGFNVALGNPDGLAVFEDCIAPENIPNRKFMAEEDSLRYLNLDAVAGNVQDHLRQGFDILHGGCHIIGGFHHDCFFRHQGFTLSMV
jgi:hypothetical protein